MQFEAGNQSLSFNRYGGKDSGIRLTNGWGSSPKSHLVFLIGIGFFGVHAVSSCCFELGVVFCNFPHLILLDAISFLLFGCCIIIFILLDAMHT
jgi:hypothetical protein